MADDKTISFPDKSMPQAEPEVTLSSEERLRAAEDRLLGEDVPRHNGKPEKGSGSRHAALPPAHLAHLHALEHLVTVESEHATAARAMQDADAKLAHALKRADDTEVASSEAEG